MKTAIWWIRRDLRIIDNPALSNALENAEYVIPLFIADPYLLTLSYTGPRKKNFLQQGLQVLDLQLTSLGSRLILRSGSPIEVLSTLVSQSGSQAIFAEADFTPYARRRDSAVAQKLPLRLIGSSGYSHPESVLKKDGKPYTVFTPYKHAWMDVHYPNSKTILPEPKALKTPDSIYSEEIRFDTVPISSQLFNAGQQNALKQLSKFVDGDNPPIFSYETNRNQLEIEGTSLISPFIRLGMLSANQAVSAAFFAIQRSPNAKSQDGVYTWLNELIWRDFYITILYHFPFVQNRSFRPNLINIPWRNDPNEFDAWCLGQTGYPVVDAAMRQLSETGWMHNRARMIVASFLVKDLLIDWRLGARWFMQQLVDGDPASNNGGWQWTAGTGTDAAPYFRIFNPVLQSKKFDSHGKYIRKWVPELENIPLKYLHEPWKMPLEVQNKSGCLIGKTYPAPIVDHAFARKRALSAYSLAKEKYDIKHKE